MCEIHSHSEDIQPRITKSITINSDLTWELFVHSNQVKKCDALVDIPMKLNKVHFLRLIASVEKLNVCAGHPEKKFVEFVTNRKGKLLNRKGDIAATIDEFATVKVNGELHEQTIRSANCQLLVNDQKCISCTRYRRTLRVLHSRWSKRESDEVSSSSHVNNRYLKTPQKLTKLSNMRQRIKNAEATISWLKEKISDFIDRSDPVDKVLHQDLKSILEENSEAVHESFPEGTFRRVFWDQQFENSKKSNAKQYRWHPLIIKWCLNLKLLSSAAYHAMRSSSFITLPSERTLRDYTKYIKSVPGYQPEVVEMLKTETKCDELQKCQTYVCLLFDEMKVKEDLVYNKGTGKIIGFCNLGSINDELLRFEQQLDADSYHPPVAKHILAVMVHGIFFKCEFPLAHFATEAISANLLYPILWEGIRLIESSGLRVIALTGVGASSNRKFFKMHGDKKTGSTCIYKTKNIYASDDKDIFFFSDVPHLIKTVRNCLSHSSMSCPSRCMWGS